MAGNQLERSGSMSKLGDEDPVGISIGRLGFRENLEGLRQQRVAGQHRDPIAEDFVTSRLSASEVIVIHRRKIVMDKRISVDAFDRRRHGYGVLPSAIACLCRRQA